MLLEKPTPREPKTDFLIDLYNQNLLSGRPQTICRVCGNPIDPSANRKNDGLDSWHLECEPKY